jgi:hypothetical protein
MRTNINEFRARPNGSYIFDASWQDLYILTEHWKSDLLFYKNDLNFLDHLIDKYVIWITKREDVELVRTIEKSIINTSEQCKILLNRVKKTFNSLVRFNG